MRLLAAVLIFVSTSMQASIEAPGLSDREYRYLTLPNALKVLLISDPTTDKAAVSMDVFVGTNNDPRIILGSHICSNTCCFSEQTNILKPVNISNSSQTKGVTQCIHGARTYELFSLIES